MVLESRCVGGIALSHNSFRWLQPPGSDRWCGFYQSNMRAEVWPDGVRGNRIARWRWEVPDFKLTGEIGGTGNDDMDRYSAQVIAANAYLDRLAMTQRVNCQSPKN